MSDIFSGLPMIALLGYPFGHAIITERSDRYIRTLRYIHIDQGKGGPFRNAPPKGFSRLRQEKLISSAARA